MTDQVAGFSAHDLEEGGGFLYARWGNPTVRILEEKIAALEGVEDCIATASGMASATAIFLTFLSAGDHAVISDVSYAGVAELARDTLRDLLEESKNDALAHAAEQASLGPRARAARLVAHANALIEAGPADEPASAWKRKLEGVAREIDAGFAAEQLDDELRGVRDQIVALLTGP